MHSLNSGERSIYLGIITALGAFVVLVLRVRSIKARETRFVGLFRFVSRLALYYRGPSQAFLNVIGTALAQKLKTKIPIKNFSEIGLFHSQYMFYKRCQYCTTRMAPPALFLSAIF
jgi:hypothetical protein